MGDKLSEQEMADRFEDLLRVGIDKKGFPSFDSFYREIACKQGIADFIAIVNKGLDSIEGFSSKTDNVSNASFSAVVSLLKPRSPRTEDFLASSTGLKVESIRKITSELLDKGIIARNEKGGITLSQSWKAPKVEIWAFELKIGNWKRALFQALQYSAFAHRVCIVLPTGKEKLLRENVEIFKNLGVGAITFNIEDRAIEIIHNPPKSNPGSRWHSLFALGKLSSLSESGTHQIGESVQ